MTPASAPTLLPPASSTAPSASRRDRARVPTEAPARAAESALTHTHHLAVTAGPRTGSTHGLDAGWTSLGRHEADVDLDDPLLSRFHLEVRLGPGRRPVQVRDLGSTNGTRIASPRRPARDGRARWRRPRPLGRRPRRLPVGARVLAGATVLEVRPRPGGIRSDESRRGAGPSGTAPAPVSPQRGAVEALTRLLPAVLTCAMVVPLVMRGGDSPWRFAWVALPLVTLAVVLVPLLGPRHRAPRPTDPAALLLDVARDVRVAGASAGTMHREGAATPLPWHLPGEPGEDLLPGAAVGVCGPGATRAARWLALRAWAACAPGTCVVRLDGMTLVDAPRPTWVIDVVHAGASLPGDAVPLPGTDAPARLRLVVARHRRHLPPWCSRVTEVPARDDLPRHEWVRALLSCRPGEGGATSGAAGVSADALWGSSMPAALSAGGSRASAAVRRHWGSSRPGSLRAPLGVGADGSPVEVDLVADGPHALVAGTTGSGKSEALVTWVLSLAVTSPPTELQFVLLDHKGGATFGALAGLPHVAGLLTDLDGAATDRALRSLTAELRRRERLLAASGVRDLTELEARPAPPGDGPGERPPRLVVVADEFRVLADSHPDLMDGLRRLAAQGRTLGIHLILATQRPAGAVGPDLRANVPLRLCLRVLEEADSTDVLGGPEAAHLPPVPGSAVLRSAGTRSLRVAWCGDGALVRATVRACVTAAGRPGLPARPRRPWAPDLPTVLSAEDLHAVDAPAAHDPGVLPLGLADLPDEQRLAPVGVDVGRGVLVIGDPGSGRATTARRLLAAAVERGWDTHLLAAGDPRHVPPARDRRGTWVGAADARRGRRLLELLTDTRTGRAEERPTLCVVEEAEAVADLLDAGVPVGTGADLLERLVRDAPRHGLHVVVTGGPGLANARWTAPLRTRLVLGVRDEARAATTGVPAPLRRAARTPGRGVLLQHDPVVVQVALPSARPTRAVGAPGPCSEVPTGVLDLAPLPTHVPLPRWRDEAAAVAPPFLPAAIGGDEGRAVAPPADLARPWVLVGGPGTGRSTALAAYAAAARAQGRPVVLWDAVTEEAPARDSLPADGVLLVDDLHPAAAVAMEALLVGAPPGLGLVLTAAEHQVGPHATGTAARATAAGTLVMLDPARSTWREVRAAADPHRRCVVVLTRGRAQAGLLPVSGS